MSCVVRIAVRMVSQEKLTAFREYAFGQQVLAQYRLGEIHCETNLDCSSGALQVPFEHLFVAQIGIQAGRDNAGVDLSRF